MQTKSKYMIVAAACFTFFVPGLNVQAQEPASAEKLVSALMDQNVAREIELVDDQRDAIKALVKELVATRSEIGVAKRRDFRNAPADDRQKIEGIYLRRFRQSQSEIADQMRDTLLPFQIERVEQVIRQQKSRQQKNRSSFGLLTPSMIKFLDISDEQQERIRDKGQQLNVEIEKEIQKIIDRAQEKLLGELTVDQRTKYKELLGEPMQRAVEAPAGDAK